MTPKKFFFIVSGRRFVVQTNLKQHLALNPKNNKETKTRDISR